MINEVIRDRLERLVSLLEETKQSAGVTLEIAKLNEANEKAKGDQFLVSLNAPNCDPHER